MRVVRSVEVIPVPAAPPVVLGIINAAGRVLPVISLRRRLMLDDQPLGLEDQFIIAKTAPRPVALVADAVVDVVDFEPSEIVRHEAIAPGLDAFEGVVKLEDGLVLIHDLTKLLSLDDAHRLDRALLEEGHVGNQH